MSTDSPEEGCERSVPAIDRGVSSGEERILVPILNEETSIHVVEVALAIAARKNADVVLLKPVSVPEQTPLELPDSLLAEHRAVLNDVLDAVSDTSVTIEGVIRVGHRTRHIVRTAIEEHTAGILVMESCDPTSLVERLHPDPIPSVYATPDCDTIVIQNGRGLVGMTSILVPVSGGPHSGVAIDVAAALAVWTDAWVELLHVTGENPSEERRREAEEYVTAGRDRISDLPNCDTWILEANDIADAIVEQSAYYDVTIMGEPRKGRLKQFVSGSTTADVRSKAENTVLTVRRRGERSRLGRWFFRGI